MEASSIFMWMIYRPNIFFPRSTMYQISSKQRLSVQFLVIWCLQNWNLNSHFEKSLKNAISETHFDYVFKHIFCCCWMHIFLHQNWHNRWVQKYSRLLYFWVGRYVVQKWRLLVNIFKVIIVYQLLVLSVVVKQLCFRKSIILLIHSI